MWGVRQSRRLPFGHSLKGETPFQTPLSRVVFKSVEKRSFITSHHALHMSKKRRTDARSSIASLSSAVLTHIFSFIGLTDEARLRCVCGTWELLPRTDEHRLREQAVINADRRLRLMLSRMTHTILTVAATDYARLTRQDAVIIDDARLGVIIRNALIANERWRRIPDRVDVVADWFEQTERRYKARWRPTNVNTDNDRCPCIVM